MRTEKVSVDFTQGGITLKLIRFAIPLFIGSVFSLMYEMVDSAVLGRFVSVQALAAVGATGTTSMLLTHLTNALTNAVSIQTSQAKGAQQHDKVRKILGNSITLTLIVGFALMVLMLFLAPAIMRLLGTPEDIRADAILYVRIVCGLYIGQLMYKLFTSVLNAIGDSRTPLYFLIFSSIVNAVLDIAFVVLFKWNVAGVAAATVIAQVLSASVCFVYMLTKHPELRFSKNDLIPDAEFLKSNAKISLPMAFQGGMLAVGDLTITAVINSFGTDAVAAYTIGWKLVALVQISYSQLTFSMSVYTGQNYGARRFDRIHEGVRKAITLIGSLCLISMGVMLMFGDKLMLIYLDPRTAGRHVQELILEYMHVTAYFLPALAMILMFLAVLRGMGHVTPTVVSSFLELSCKIGLSLLLPIWFGTRGLWFAMPLGWVLGLIPPAWFYYFGKWEEKAARQDGKQSSPEQA